MINILGKCKVTFNIFFFIDKKTEDELNHAREQSAKLRGEIRKLKTELEVEKQNHEKTLQELKELKSLHGKGNEAKELAITPDGLQKKETTTESLSQKEQDQARQKEDFEEDERLLQKCDYVDEKNKQEKQSENLEAAKAEQEKIRQLHLENKQLKEKVTEKTLEYEKILARKRQIKRKLKNSLEKIQAESKDKEVLLMNMRVENKRLHEESNAERSKCDALSEEVRRLREMPGRKCFVQLLPHCRPRHQKRTFFLAFCYHKKRSYTNILIISLVKEREGGGNGCEMSDQSPFTIVVAMY